MVVNVTPIIKPILIFPKYNYHKRYFMADPNHNSSSDHRPEKNYDRDMKNRMIRTIYGPKTYIPYHCLIIHHTQSTLCSRSKANSVHTTYF